MPILAREPSLFPEGLLESPDFRAGLSHWMVLYTKARQEKSVARDLGRRGVAHYLPLVKRHLKYGRKRMVSYVPLFTGYVFLLGTESERVFSLATNRVIRVLAVGDERQLQTDLQQIQRLIASNVPLTPESRLDKGNRVRVRDGVLMGVEGMVVRRRAETRLLVSVNFLQQGASVEIDDFSLEPLD